MPVGAVIAGEDGRGGWNGIGWVNDRANFAVQHQASTSSASGVVLLLRVHMLPRSPSAPSLHSISREQTGQQLESALLI